MASLESLMKRTFPSEMTTVPLWLNFKLVDKGDGKFGKPPVSPYTGEICSKTDESSYVDFERALMAVEQYELDGVGFVFKHGFIAIDLDNCFDEDGKLTALAGDVVDHFIDTYMEYSPSGNGLHIFCKGDKPNSRTRSEGLEVYAGNNFVTVTGDKVPESGDKVLNMQSSLNWLFDTYLPDLESTVKPDVIYVNHDNKSVQEWLEIGLTHDEKFNKLFNDTDHLDDESGHDMALLCKLTYWLNRDIPAIEDMFFLSPWVQSKDKAHLKKLNNRDDYLETSINKAVSMVSSCASENSRRMQNKSTASLQLEENNKGDVILPLKEYTDVANARLFVEIYSEELAFTEEWGWCCFCGEHWERNQFYKAQEYGVMFAENMMYIANQYMDKLTKECEAQGIAANSKVGKDLVAPAAEFMRHAKATNSERGIKAMLKLAESMMKVPVSLFDGNPWVLNTPNVVVDLRTGEAFPPAWNHYNTMVCGVSYNPEPENHGMWDSFLKQIFLDDPELISYVQMRLGSACVGKVYEENLLIANGSGSNGKSTCFNVLKAVLGDYCVSVNPDILMDKVNYEQQVAVASIKGKRLVIGQETESGQRLSTAAVKRMVSSDAIVGRILNHGYIEFEPTHTTMLATNHLPEVKDNDEGTWRRITVLPFEAVITRDTMITNYQDILLETDGEYILKWLVDGAIRFYENGCAFDEKPLSVQRASVKYRKSQMGCMDSFISECLTFYNPIEHPKLWSDPDEIYDAYSTWCAAMHIKPYNKMVLSRKMGEYGMLQKTVRRGNKTQRGWFYVALKGTEAIS